MTTVALIVGRLPVAIIDGLISSTLLTLVVVPAAYSYIDRFRIWSGSLLRRTLSPPEKHE